MSVSRRTDVPAFYARWLMARIRAGWCEWVNPFGGQLQRVSLEAPDVLALVFWTRNPEPLMPHLDELTARGYTFYFHFTITGYPRLLEPYDPPMELSIERFRALSQRIGPERVFWRYDPIILGQGPGWSLDGTYHARQFEALATALGGYTRRCYFSFLNLYAKTRRRLAKIGVTPTQAVAAPGVAGGEGTWERGGVWGIDVTARAGIARELAGIAARHGMTMYACCDDEVVGGPVRKARCVDAGLVAQLRGQALPALRPRPSRAGCGCVESIDIGAYDTCLFGCAYCYATTSHGTARSRRRLHDPRDAALWRPGGPAPGHTKAGPPATRRAATATTSLPGFEGEGGDG